MAVTVLGRTYSTAFQQSVDNQFRLNADYTVTYIVRVDDDCDDENSILASNDIPRLNDKSELYPGLRVVSHSLTEVDYLTWEVVVTYRLPRYESGSTPDRGSGVGPGSPEGGDVDPEEPEEITDEDPKEEPPWMRGAKLSINTSKKKSLMSYASFWGTDQTPTPEPTYFSWLNPNDLRWGDRYGIPSPSNPSTVVYQPVTNSSGEPIYYDYDRVVYEITLEKSYETLNGGTAAWLANVNTVSIGPVTLAGVQWPGMTVLLDGAQLSEDFWTDPESGTTKRYWNVTFRYIIDPEGHFEQFADVGSVYFPGNRTSSNTEDDALVYRNSENEVLTGPLNGYGDKGNGRVPYLRYCPYEVKVW